MRKPDRNPVDSLEAVLLELGQAERSPWPRDPAGEFIKMDSVDVFFSGVDGNGDSGTCSKFSVGV